MEAEARTDLNLSAVEPGRLIPLALETINFYRRFMERPDGRELLEKKKAELRARGVI